MKKKRFSIVIATDDKNGIGKNGTLAWRIKEDMDFFRTLTMTTKKSHRQNAVIMGRKTWESIPEKFRPLPGRINCILSSSYSENPTIINPTTFGFSDFEDCHIFLSKRVDIENIFIIGGSYLYNLVLETPCLEYIYITKVSGDFSCDTFFSPIPEKFLVTQTGEKKTVDGLSYQMFVYKNKEKKKISLPHISSKNMIFGAAAIGVVILLFSISFLFSTKKIEDTPVIQPVEENPIIEEVLVETVSEEAEIPADQPLESTDTTIEPIIKDLKTEENNIIIPDIKEERIEGSGYSIIYPVETLVDTEIEKYIEEKKLEYKIKYFNAKNAGDNLNWKIEYKITANEILFTETRSGEKVSETKIPLN